MKHETKETHEIRITARELVDLLRKQPEFADLRVPEFPTMYIDADETHIVLHWNAKK